MLILLKIIKIEIFRRFINFHLASSVFYQYLATADLRQRSVLKVWIAFQDLSGCQGVISMLILLKITKINIYRGFNNLYQSDLVLYQYSTSFNSRSRRLLDIWIDLKHLSGYQGVMLCLNIAETSENQSLSCFFQSLFR